MVCTYLDYRAWEKSEFGFQISRATLPRAWGAIKGGVNLAIRFGAPTARYSKAQPNGLGLLEKMHAA